MSTFTQGDKLEKTFWIEDSETGEAVDISNLVGMLYEVKTNRPIQRFDSDGVNPAPTDLGEGQFKFTFTPEITRLCPVGVEVWFDVWVGSMERIFRGRFGTALKSPLSDEQVPLS